jgi:hypothetical protein
MYIVNEKNERINIEDVDLIEKFESGGKKYDDFGFAAFIISIILILICLYQIFFSGGEEEVEELSAMSLPSSIELAEFAPPAGSVRASASSKKSSSSKKKSKGRRYR